MAVERVRQMSVEEYFDFAESSEEWYEYIDGELCPMTTATFRHNVISNNIAFQFRILLADQNCQTLGMGQGIGIGETRFLIPDVCVVCGNPLLEIDSRILLNPILVVEVTSPTSIDYDRGAKLEYYFDVPALQTYLIVDQHRVLVEMYTRGDGDWQMQSYNDLVDEIPLDALNCQLPLREIYRGIDFKSETPAGATEE